MGYPSRISLNPFEDEEVYSTLAIDKIMIPAEVITLEREVQRIIMKPTLMPVILYYPYAVPIYYKRI